MAVNDFTGKNIQDTYQKVVQTDGTNLADGTGSLLPISFEGNDVIIPGALKAQSYIVSESIINVSSGSTAFGNSIDDTHTFIGNITSSGNISASGNNHTFGGNVNITNEYRSNGQPVAFSGISWPVIGNSNTNPITIGRQDVTPITLSGAVTASGNISASGAIHTNTIFGNDTLNINPNQNGPAFAGNTHALQVYGGIKAGISPGTSHFFDGNITASGNISASGDIQFNTLTGTINGGTF